MATSLLRSRAGWIPGLRSSAVVWPVGWLSGKLPTVLQTNLGCVLQPVLGREPSQRTAVLQAVLGWVLQSALGWVPVLG